MLTFLPADVSCPMKESSVMEEPPKFEPMSMKVGREPVVIPFNRCSVVVGGSENISSRNDRDGCRAVSSWGRTSTLWWYGETGCGG